MGKPAVLKIEIAADASGAAKELGKAADNFDKLGDAADQASSHMDSATSGGSDIADTFGDANSKTAQLAGGLGDLGGALSQAGGPLGAVGTGMELLGPSIMGVAGAADILELATGTLSATNLKNAASTAASTVATVASTVASKAAAVASKAWAIAQAALNLVMDANPIMLVVLAIAALVAAFVIAWKNSETFRNIVKGVFSAVVTAAQAVWSFIKTAFAAIGQILLFAGKLWFMVYVKPWIIAYGILRAAISAAIGWVKSAFSSLVNAVRSILSAVTNAITAPFAAAWHFIESNVISPLRNAFGNIVGAIKSAMSGVYEAIKGPFESAWNWIKTNVIDRIGGAFSGAIQVVKNVWNSFASFWNGIEVSIPGISLPGPLPDIPGFTLGLPDLPYFARGAYVTGPTAAVIGEAGNEFVAPEPMLRRLIRDELGAGGVQITVNGALDPDAVARQIESLLRRRDRRVNGVTRRGAAT